jgi:hypothetical protein
MAVKILKEVRAWYNIVFLPGSARAWQALSNSYRIKLLLSNSDVISACFISKLLP